MVPVRKQILINMVGFICYNFNAAGFGTPCSKPHKAPREQGQQYST